MRLTVMSRRTLGRCINDTYGKTLTDLKKQLQDIKNVCTTADIWSGKERSFLGVTCHWINSDLQRVTATLACRRFAGTHSYDRIALLLESIHNEFNLDCQKVLATVTDSKSNFVKAFKEFGLEEESCNFPDEESVDESISLVRQESSSSTSTNQVLMNDIDPLSLSTEDVAHLVQQRLIMSLCSKSLFTPGETSTEMFFGGFAARRRECRCRIERNGAISDATTSERPVARGAPLSVFVFGSYNVVKPGALTDRQMINEVKLPGRGHTIDMWPCSGISFERLLGLEGTMDNRARRMVNCCTKVPPFNPHDAPEVRKRCNDDILISKNKLIKMNNTPEHDLPDLDMGGSSVPTPIPSTYVVKTPDVPSSIDQTVVPSPISPTEVDKTHSSTCNIPAMNENEEDFSPDDTDISVINNSQNDEPNNMDLGRASPSMKPKKGKETLCLGRKTNVLSQEYISRTGKTISAKEMKPPCSNKCRYKCSEHISEGQRYEIFNMYWDLSSLQRQLSTKASKNQCRKKQKTEYFLFYYLAVTDIKEDQTYCYFWHEAMGGRGAIEIGSCILKYLQQLAGNHPG
ncbi:hypothetical protein HW555_009981, partial [Spodoptera exigua]